MEAAALEQAIAPISMLVEGAPPSTTPILDKIGQDHIEGGEGLINGKVPEPQNSMPAIKTEGKAGPIDINDMLENPRPITAAIVSSSKTDVDDLLESLR